MPLSAFEPNDRRTGLGRALLITAASAVPRGLAHLRSGRRAAGTVMMSTFLGTLAAGGLAVAAFHDNLLQLVVRPRLLVALGWPALVICSYRSVGPAKTTRKTEIIAAMVVG